MKNASVVAKLLIITLFLLIPLVAFHGFGNAQNKPAASDGPMNQGSRVPRQDGNARSGRDVFRFETFGNEGFWTDAVKRVGNVRTFGIGTYLDT